MQAMIPHTGCALTSLLERWPGCMNGCQHCNALPVVECFVETLRPLKARHVLFCMAFCVLVCAVVEVQG